MLEGQEDSLFECRLRNYLAKHVMFLLHVLGANPSNPPDKRLSLRSKRAPPHNFAHEVFLSASILVEISPTAEVITQFKLRLSTTHAVHHFHGANFISINTFAIQVQLTPKEEEFLTHLMADVSINNGVPLVIFVDYIESLAVPDSEIEPFSVHDVITKHSL